MEFITELSHRIKIMEKGSFAGEVDLISGQGKELLQGFSGFGGSKNQKLSSPTAEATPPRAPEPIQKVTAAEKSQTQPTKASFSDAPLTERIVKMTVRRPTIAQLKEITLELGMQLSDEQIKEFLENMQGSLDAYDLVDGMPDYLPPVLYPRTSGSRPTDEENPLNGWYIKTEVRGAPKGPLSGKTVALKDNVCLAGVPMMNGSSTLKGYTPDVDATVVTRLLDAGATITGKAHCEYYCFSGAVTRMQRVQSITRS